MRQITLITVLIWLAMLIVPRPGSASGSTSSYRKLALTDVMGKFPDGLVAWQYNPAGKPTVFDDNGYFLSLVAEAIAEIEGVSNVSFEFQGTTTAGIGDIGDGVVTIGWADIGSAAGIAGPAQLVPPCATETSLGYCAYVDGSFRLNNNVLGIDWDTGDQDTTERLLIQVVTHELLHLLGVGHSDEQISIMFANPYTNLNHLRADDIEILQGLYGKPAQPISPMGFVPPAPGGTVIDDSFAGTNQSFPNPVTSIDEAETSTNVGVIWETTAPFTETLSFVAVDPDGFYYRRRFSSVGQQCTPPSVACVSFIPLIDTQQIKTYPGDWSFYVVDSAGDLISTENLMVNTSPTTNDVPESTLTVDTPGYWEFDQLIYGVSPLPVDMTLTILGDTEGDTVDASWHIPTLGQTTVGPAGSNCIPCDEDFASGVTSKTVTFDAPGVYEAYVTVNDDFSRYGLPGLGNEAGPGFRTLYRREFRVTVSRDDIAGLTDISGDMVPDLAVFEERTETARPRIELFSGADGSSLGGVSFLNTAWRGIAFDQVEDVNGDGTADDPGLAILSFNPATGRILVQVKRLSDYATIKNIIYLDAKWAPVDVVVFNDTNGDGNPNDASIGVLARLKSNGKNHVEIRNLSDGARIAGHSFLGTAYRAVATAAVPRAGQTPLVGVVAENISTGDIVVQSRQLSDGALQRDTSFLSPTWSAADLTATADGNNDGNPGDPAWLVLGARETTGENLAQSRLVSNGARIKNMSFLSPPFRISRLTSTTDISGNNREEVVAFARRRGDAKRFIQLRDYATDTITRNISP